MNIKLIQFIIKTSDELIVNQDEILKIYEA